MGSIKYVTFHGVVKLCLKQDCLLKANHSQMHTFNYVRSLP